MNKILIVDDEQANLEMILKFAQLKAIDVTACIDPIKAIEIVKQEQFKLIILDVMMPKMDGYELISQMQQYTDAKFLFLSAKGELKDRIYGLELGAIDYMLKPFSLEELFLKISNIINYEQNYQLKYDDLILDIKHKTLYHQNEQLIITNTLFDLLYELIAQANVALSRSYLLDQVWGTSEAYSSRTVDIHIHKLRVVLGKKGYKIVTVRNQGYMYENKI